MLQSCSSSIVITQLQKWQPTLATLRKRVLRLVACWIDGLNCGDAVRRRHLIDAALNHSGPSQGFILRLRVIHFVCMTRVLLTDVQVNPIILHAFHWVDQSCFRHSPSVIDQRGNHSCDNRRVLVAPVAWVSLGFGIEAWILALAVVRLSSEDCCTSNDCAECCMELHRESTS